MHRRSLVWLVPILLFGIAGLARPASVAAASPDSTETGVTTYELVPDKGLVHVTINLAIVNHKKDVVSVYPCMGGAYTCTDTKRWYLYSTTVAVEAGAGKVTATSNAGAVKQAVSSTDKFYRYIKLTYPNLYYGQTRKLTISYDIVGAAPRTNGATRAGKAYANFCVVGNGFDGGSVSAILPAGYTVDVTYGDDLAAKVTTAGGKTTYSSGSVTDPFGFYACLEGVNETALQTQAVTTGDSAFTIEAWPEDTKWAADVKDDVTTDIAEIEDLFGLTFPPGAPIVIREAADAQMGNYDGVYDSIQRTATVSEEADPATVAHELSHIWFNKDLFDPRWLAEGFAGYSEKLAGLGHYTACTEPGAYPGSGKPDLEDWLLLDTKSTAQDEKVSDYQYAAACYIVSSVADTIGPERMRDVLHAAAGSEIAYLGKGAPETIGRGPVNWKRWLDMIDERGMVPAGKTDLDETQKLLATFGIAADSSELQARSEARAAYHKLEAAAAGWEMPFAIRGPMANWNFADARKALATANQIVQVRDQIRSRDPKLTLDATRIQQQFEGAANQQALDDVLVLIEQEADAAAKVGEATTAYNGNRSLFQTVGLMGADVKTPYEQATAALEAVEPDQATAAAADVLDLIGRSNDTGVQRVGLAAGGMLGALLLVVLLAFFLRRRRRHAFVPAPAGGPGSGLPDGVAMLPAAPPSEWQTWAVPAAPDPVAPPAGPDDVTRVWTLPAQPPIVAWPESAAPPAPPATQAPMEPALSNPATSEPVVPVGAASNATAPEAALERPVRPTD